MQRRVMITALVFATATQLVAQANPAERSAKVDQIMSAIVQPGAPGAAVMVIRDGKIMHQKGYGLANVDAKTPIDEHTIFDLASVSKQFTAMAIMILAERGKLSYDDSLTKFFPELPAYASKITIRHLLNHTSGLPDYMGEYQKLGKPEFEPSSREVIGMLAGIREPLFAAGEKWQYSNSGYVVLAQVAEKASGVAFPAFAKANIFDPLGMKSSVVADNARPTIAHRAISYRGTAGSFQNIDYTPLNRIYGDGNVNTSIEDMYKWDQALYTDKLVTQATLEKAFTPGKLNDGSRTTYGFGWAIGEVNGRRMVSHSGAWVGFRTFIARVPSEKLTVIVLTNAANYNPAAAGQQIGQVYLVP